MANTACGRKTNSTMSSYTVDLSRNVMIRENNAGEEILGNGVYVLKFKYRTPKRRRDKTTTIITIQYGPREKCHVEF